MTSVARIDLDRIEELAASATPGPWSVESDGLTYYVWCKAPESSIDTWIAADRNVAENLGPRDSEFIAALDPQSVLALVHAVKAAQNIHTAPRDLISLAEKHAALTVALRPFTEEPGEEDPGE